MIRRVGWTIGVLLLALAVCQPAIAIARPPAKPPPPSAPGTYVVPKKIPDDCSVAVEGKIMSWLATVPNGSTVQFGAGRCYGQDGTITLAGRSGLVIDGGGSEFRALTPGGSHRANWRLVTGSNLTLRNMAVRGSNPRAVRPRGRVAARLLRGGRTGTQPLERPGPRHVGRRGVPGAARPRPPAETTPPAPATSSSPVRSSSGAAGREWRSWTPRT